VVERIHRYGDRGRNAGDLTAEQEARDAAQRAEKAASIDEARQIELALQEGGAEEDAPVMVGQEVVKKKKKGFFRRWLFGDDDDVDTDNS
jgi:hypothetical protein